VFYTSPMFFEWEKEHLLRDQWHCVGRVDELPEVGDYLTTVILDEPVLVVRSAAGPVALSNVCRHRGMPIATGQGSARRFVCSYHAWTYGLDGALLRAPRMENAGSIPPGAPCHGSGCATGTGSCMSASALRPRWNWAGCTT